MKKRMFGLVLTACSFAPRYERPEQDIPAFWQQVDNGAPVLEQNWWVRFNDPVLTALIEEALRNNQDLEESLAKIDAANRELSTAAPRTDFNGILGRHGRAVVAVAVACTLRNRWERLEGWGIEWALAVLDLLPFVWTQGNMDRATIRDTVLHPTAICDYAGDFIRLTSED